MCDIVNSPCKVCGQDLPLHLGDFETDSNEVECFCAKHLPDTNVRVFTLIEDSMIEEYSKESEFKKGWQMGIRDLTDNARKNSKMNMPNVAADYTEELR
jgi:hypothetical protein